MIDRETLTARVSAALNPLPDISGCPNTVADVAVGAVLREVVAEIARDIRRELVCCDVYERDQGTDRAGRTHPICFWGEAAARVAESHATEGRAGAGAYDQDAR